MVKHLVSRYSMKKRLFFSSSKEFFNSCKRGGEIHSANTEDGLWNFLWSKVMFAFL